MKKILFRTIPIAALIGVFFLASILTGAGEQTPKQPPSGEILMLWDSDNSISSGVSIQLVENFVVEFPSKLKTVDTANTKVDINDLNKADVLWVHPAALSSLDEQERTDIESVIKSGKPTVYLSKQWSQFFSTFNVTGIGINHEGGNATIVGVGIEYNNNSDIPSFIVISAPSDRLKGEGDVVAINALIGGSNHLLD
jgi:hypothetical protein